MILALDIGNTHIVLGCMEGRRIRYLCRMATNRLTTGAEYAVTISRLLEFGHIAPDAFEAPSSPLWSPRSPAPCRKP